MSRNKKKHVCSCGEEFNHGIGLRKHQRQTGHKGSSIVDDEAGGEEEGSEVEPSPAAAPPPPPVPQAAPTPPPRASAPPARADAPPPIHDDDDDDDDDPSDQTMPVARPAGYGQEPQRPSWPPEHNAGPTRFQHNRQKLSLVSRGLRVLVSYRARSAGHQIKQSARSGADIFAEAAKIAVALLLLIAIPTGIFLWWRSQRGSEATPANVPGSFSADQGALSARSAALGYLDALKKEQWDDAYGRLSSGWRQELSGPSFRDSFLGISDIRWAASDQKLLPDGSAEVSLVMAFLESGRPQKFQGRFRMSQEGQSWKVDRVELSAAPSR